MKTSHTAGKWEIHGRNINGEILIGKEGEPNNTGRIAKIGWDCCGFDSEEWKANARLIAAAPEMLDILLKLQKAFIHVEGDTKGNKTRTEIFDNLPEFRDIANEARQLITYNL